MNLFAELFDVGAAQTHHRPTLLPQTPRAVRANPTCSALRDELIKHFVLWLIIN